MLLSRVSRSAWLALALAAAAALALRRRAHRGDPSADDDSAASFKPGSLLAGRRRCLILGDGNLSFALAVVRALRRERPWQRYLPGALQRWFTQPCDAPPEQLLITTYDTVPQLQEKYGAEVMDRVLSELSADSTSLVSVTSPISTHVAVDHGVDATKLTEYFRGGCETPRTTLRQFDLIVWNFPHWGGRGYIQRNRRLLKAFFASAAPHLAPGGEVHVALKEGQGGTPIDKELGSMGNTWRVVENAASAGLVLASVRPFEPPPGYSCSGRRSTSKGFWMGGSLNHVFVHAADGLRPGKVEPAGIFPPLYVFDVSFWVLDEALYTPSDVIAVSIAADDCVQSVNFQDEIVAVPRDANISQGAPLRSIVYRIQYQSRTGPESRESMLCRHDGVRSRLAASLFPSIMVRGSTRFQQPFVEKILASPRREKIVHLKGFGSGLSEHNLFEVAFPLVVAEVERVATLATSHTKAERVDVKIVFDGDPFQEDCYTALVPKLLRHFSSSKTIRLSLCAYRCRNPDGGFDAAYEKGSPESTFVTSWRASLGTNFDLLEVRTITPPDGMNTWTEVDESSDAWHTLWATLGARSLGATAGKHVVVVGGGECTAQEWMLADEETEWMVIHVSRAGRRGGVEGPAIPKSSMTRSDSTEVVYRVKGGAKGVTE